jgi:HEAT repeat protein
VTKDAYPENIEKLIEDLNSDDYDIRRDAAKALGVIGDARAVEPLISMLEDEGYETAKMDERDLENMDDIREKAAAAAAEALGKISDERAVEPLIDVISSDNEWSPEDKYGEDWRLIRDRAAWALGKIGDARAIDTLMALALETEAEVRWCVVGALGEFISKDSGT